MDTDLDLSTLNLVCLELSHVMSNVVDLVQMPAARFGSECLLKCAARGVSQQLSVRKGEVCRGAHRSHICLAFGGVHRRADELPVRQVDAVFVDRVLEGLDIVSADLVSEPARAAVDLHDQTALEESHRIGGLFIKYLIDH